MNCNEAIIFLSQLRAKCITSSISDEDLDYLIRTSYVECLSKDEFEKLSSSVADLSKIQSEDESAHEKEQADVDTLNHDRKKVHSIRFWFEGREKKELDRKKVQEDEQIVTKDEGNMHGLDDELQPLIQKKSVLDKQVLCNERYLSLTGTGSAVLRDLTVRSHRVGERDFKDFVMETKSTEIELQSIAERASKFYSDMKLAIANIDTTPLITNDNDNDEDENEDDYRIKAKRAESSQLWAIAIGLAKLEVDYDKIKESFVQTINTLNELQEFKNSNLDNKLMAAETLVASGHTAGEEEIDTLKNIIHQIRQNARVPEELSAGIATTLFCGANPDKLTRFDNFTKITRSCAAAALLAISKEPEDNLKENFDSFKSIFDEWGISPSEDTDLAAAYLAISGQNIARPKMNTLVDGVKNEFEFPLVPAAILTSIQALDADELLDLAEKAASILQSQPLCLGLTHSELASLAIRMIYGQ